MTNIILFGPPGSGKGTQSKKLIKKYDFFHISTGDLFRLHIAEKTQIGKQIKTLVNNGKLVPDETTIFIIEDIIRKHINSVEGFLFDGFPRTLNQAISLDYILQKQDMAMAIDFAIVLNVSKRELESRLAKRKQVEHRADDDACKIETRMKVFFENTTKIFSFYESQNKLHMINALGEENEVFQKIRKIINQHKT